MKKIISVAIINIRHSPNKKHQMGMYKQINDRNLTNNVYSKQFF